MSIIPPFLTVLVAAIVAWIAYQQFAVARERLKLDLFEMRFAVFQATRSFLNAIAKDAKLEREDLSEFQRDTQQATFLFGPEIEKYLQSLVEKSLEMRKTRLQYDPLPKSPERSALCEKETKLLQELMDELMRGKDEFAPYLRLVTWRSCRVPFLSLFDK